MSCILAWVRLGPAFSLLVLRKARAPRELHFGLGPAFALQLQQGLAVLLSCIFAWVRLGPAFSLLLLRKARAPRELYFWPGFGWVRPFRFWCCARRALPVSCSLAWVRLGPAFSLLVLRKPRAPRELYFRLGPAGSGLFAFGVAQAARSP